LPDEDNTYTSYYFDKPLDIDFFSDCGTWTTFGKGASVTCYTNYGSMMVSTQVIGAGAYIELDTEIDSTYVLKIYITGYTAFSTWQISARDNQGNIIESATVTTTGEISFEFEATTSTSRVYIVRTGGFTSSTININQLSVTGKHPKKEDIYLSYRYAFNNKEKDHAGMGGGGSTYDYGFRIYNPQIAKFLSVDPLFQSFPWYTPYQFAGNKPIIAIDLDGLEEKIVIRKRIADQNSTLLYYLNWSDVFPGKKHGKYSETGTITLTLHAFTNSPDEPTGAVEFIFSDLRNDEIFSIKGFNKFDRPSSKIEKHHRFEGYFEGSSYHSGDIDFQDAKAAGRIALSYALGGWVSLAFQINAETKRYRVFSDNTFVGGLVDNTFSLEKGSGDDVVNTAQLTWSLLRVGVSFKNFVKESNPKSPSIFKDKNVTNAARYMKSMGSTANDAAQQTNEKRNEED